DPLHNADTEQFIYNSLDEWLAAAADGNDVLLEINEKGVIYQAKVNRGFFEQRARNILLRIRQELDALGGGADILVPATTAALPGMSLYVPGTVAIDDGAVAANCLAAMEHIQGDPEALNFVTSLPVAGRGAAVRARAQDDLPSHILVNHRAYALPPHMLYVGPRPATLPGGQGVGFIELDDP